MGFWGTHWRQNDSYLDLRYMAVKLVDRTIEKAVQPRTSDAWLMRNAWNIYVACGFLQDLLPCHDPGFSGEQELLAKAADALCRVILLEALKVKREEKQLQRHLKELLRRISCRLRKPHQVTSLGARIAGLLKERRANPRKSGKRFVDG